MKPEDILKPVSAYRSYHRNLPHFEDPGSVYFITFRTIDNLILSDMAKDIIFKSIKYHADKKYKLCSCVVLDTHVHLVVQPLEEDKGRYFSLSQIMHSIKSYSAHMIKKLSNHEGRIWQDESYDRVIRDDAEYLEKMEYIINNPLKAGLVDRPEDYQWLFVDGLE